VPDLQQTVVLKLSEKHAVPHEDTTPQEDKALESFAARFLSLTVCIYSFWLRVVLEEAMAEAEVVQHAKRSGLWLGNLSIQFGTDSSKNSWSFWSRWRQNAQGRLGGVEECFGYEGECLVIYDYVETDSFKGIAHQL
jgi:hypothetical protein